MKKTHHAAGMTFLLVGLVLGSPQPLAAYIDPGSGSYLLQIFVAGLLGASFAVKRFWGDIVAVFRRSASKSKENTPSSE